MLITLFFLTWAFLGVNALINKEDKPASQTQNAILQEQPAPGGIPQTAVSLVVGEVARVSSPGVLDLVVEPQPVNVPGYVTTEMGKASQFQSATPYSTVGILAHNYLSGAQFFNVQHGGLITVTFKNGQVGTYQVARIERYQALSPTNEFSDFIDLETREKLAAGELFNRIYAPGNRLVLQTCIDAYGDRSWGRFFVIAASIEN